MRKLVTPSILHILSNAVSTLLPILTIPLLIARLGLESYGYIALLQLIAAASLPIIDGGVGQLAMRFIKRKKIVKSYFQSIHFFWFLIATTPVAIYMYIFHPFLFVPLLISQGCTLFIFHPAPYALAIDNKQSSFVCSQFFLRLLHTIFIILFIHAKNDINMFFTSQFILSIFVSCLLFKGDVISSWHKSNKIFFKLLVSSFLYNLRRLSNLPIPYVLPLLVVRNLGVDALSIYSILEKIRGVLWQVIYPILFNKVPLICSFHKTSNLMEMNKLSKTTSSSINFIAILFVTFILVSFFILKGHVHIKNINLNSIGNLTIFTFSVSLIFYSRQAFFSSIYGALFKPTLNQIYILFICSMLAAFVFGFLSIKFGLMVVFMSNIIYDLVCISIYKNLIKKNENNSY
jgi:O-antigen/teichoic acid export membrane protein